MKTLFSRVWGFFRYSDLYLLILCVTISGFSSVLLYSVYTAGFAASGRIYLTQILASTIGIFVAICVSNINYKVIAKLWMYHLPFTLLLVVLTYFIGITPAYSDDKAWLDLGVMTLQPAELLKFSFIVSFAIHLTAVKGRVNNLRNFTLLSLHGGGIIAVVAFQGDLGTALVFVFVFMIMIFAGGLSLKYILLGLSVIVCLSPVVWIYILPDYLKMRFAVAYNPEIDPLVDGYQQLLGKTALGAGRVVGKGLFSKDLIFVPECYNDFIFSYIGQTLGFLGCIFTVGMICLICTKILLNVLKFNDYLGRYICIGVFAVIFSQSLINIGMVVCLLPVIGITLPFISSGGSSVVSLYLCIGLVLSVYKQNKQLQAARLV